MNHLLLPEREGLERSLACLVVPVELGAGARSHPEREGTESMPWVIETMCFLFSPLATIFVRITTASFSRMAKVAGDTKSAISTVGARIGCTRSANLSTTS
jgi:hypothetical protein